VIKIELIDGPYAASLTWDVCKRVETLLRKPLFEIINTAPNLYFTDMEVILLESLHAANNNLDKKDLRDLLQRSFNEKGFLFYAATVKELLGEILRGSEDDEVIPEESEKK